MTLSTRAALIAAVLFIALLPTSARAQQAQSSAADTEAPKLVALSVSPATVDVSSGRATVTLTARITDNDSGVSYAEASLTEPGGSGGRRTRFNLTSGTAQDGIHTATIDFFGYSKMGVWKVGFASNDVRANRMNLGSSDLAAAGFDHQFEVVASPPDTEAPELVAFSISPATVAPGKTVTVTAQITDNDRGVEVSSFKVGFPNGGTRGYRLFLNSGTKQDGVHTESFSAGEPGTYTILSVNTTDGGNERTLTTSDLVAAGFAYEFEVVDGTPVLLEPASGSDAVAFGSPSFRWATSASRSAADQFVLEIDKSSAFENPISIGTQGATVEEGSDFRAVYTYQGVRLNPSTDYHWRMTYSPTGAVSASRAFTTAANQAPTPTSDVAETDEDTEVEVVVLANDSDPDAGTALFVTEVSKPAHGTATLTCGGTILYTPDVNFNGTDTFVYTVDDGDGLTTSRCLTSAGLSASDRVAGDAGPLVVALQASAEAKVTVTVRPVDDAPGAVSVLSPSASHAIVLPSPDDVVMTWDPSKEVDGDKLSYRWELSASKTFETVLLSHKSSSTKAVVPGTDFLEAAAKSGLTPGSSMELYHRVATSDGTSETAGEVSTLLVERVMNTGTDGAPGTTFALQTGYPNPTAGRFTVTVDLPSSARVDVAVYDALGREVASSAFSAVPAGRQSLDLDLTLLGPGLYVYRMAAELAGSTESASGRVTIAR